jgi:AraC-like DNA-binding protein
MRIFLLFFILTCCGGIALAQSTTLDSLLQQLERHPRPDTNRVRLLMQISWAAWGTEPFKLKTYSEQALKLAQDLKDTRGIADALSGIGYYYWSQTEFDRSMEFTLKAVREYERCHDQAGVSRCYGTIGLGYAQANNYDKSIEYHLRALEINQKINNKKGIARDVNNLGYAYELKKDYRQSLRYYQQALQLRIELDDREGAIMPQSNVGSAYLYLGNYTLALDYFFKALAEAKAFNNKNLIALSYQNIGEASYKNGNYRDGEQYLFSALQLANEIGDKKRREEAYKILTALEESRKNYAAAFDYLTRLQGVRDTLYTQERTRQVAEMEARFETEKKEQAIQLLEQEKRIDVLWRNILTAGMLLLVSAFIVVYFHQQFRERKNRELLNLQIDLLTAQTQELTDKYRMALVSGADPSFETTDQRLVKKALEVVERNISDPLFGVERLADEMGMSRANLHRKMKTVTGFSPGDFIRNVRLKRAAWLLQNQADSVSQIGLTVGFEDQSYFSKSFKKQFGVSPSEYFRSSAVAQDN